MGRAVRAHAVRRNARWSAMLFHLFLKQFQCGLAIPGLGNHTFQHLTPVINSTPEIVRHTAHLHKYLVEIPAPVIASAHSFYPLAPKFCSQHRTNPVPPIAHFFCG